MKQSELCSTGSGILTTTRLTKEYAGKGRAIFIEGGTFKTILPLPDGKAIIADDTVIDTVNDTVTDTVKKRIVLLINELIKQPGLKSKDLANITGVSEVSIRRDMQKLGKLIEFRGVPKKGGYFLTEYMQTKLNKKD